ncbi:hypothetical protein [Ferrimonas balearica]|uniref:hypothetical protein n=1 Tax=Ferrimonas balearica TaxID=44012 RepID=UPI001C999C3F|nr:hypothetical protein [Ferrimonas balearica]MBY5991023.1 hypothetical protein [Ferrimonas balearica]
MVWMVLALIPAMDSLPFAPGDHYICQAGPHHFNLTVDNRGDRHVSRYALVRPENIAMPQIRYSRYMQWQILRLDGSPLALMRFLPEHWTLEVALLDREGDLVDTSEHPTHCQEG